MDYHSHKFTEASVMVFKNSKLVAVLPANKVHNTVYSHQGLSYGGVLISKTDKLEQVIAYFKAILSHYNSLGICSVIIKAIPDIYTKQPSDFLNYLCYVLKASVVKAEVVSVINNKTEDVQVSKQRVRGLKKAQNHSLVVKQDNNIASFYTTILVPNLMEVHHTTPVHSLKELQLLQTRFPENIKQFNVYHNDNLVAGVTVFETEKVAHAQYIASNQDRQLLGSLDLLFFHLINDVYKEKLYFSFGNSNQNNGLHINSGLLYFKESLGARTITQQTFEFKTANHKFLDSIFI